MIGQIDKNVVGFLKKISAGENIKECLLVATEKGIAVKQSDPDEFRYVDAELKSNDEGIIKWEVKGEDVELPLMDLSLFMKMIFTFDGLLNMDRKDEMVIFSSKTETGSKVCEYMCCDKALIAGIDKVWPLTDNDYSITIPMKKDFLLKIVKNIDILNEELVIVSGDGKSINFTVGIDKDSSRIVESIKIDNGWKGEIVLGSDQFKGVVNSFTENIINIGVEVNKEFQEKHGMKDQCPIMFREESKNFKIVNFIAPLGLDE